MKKQWVISALMAFGVLSLAGCAPILSGAMNASLSEKEVATKTADYFGTQEKNINITNIDKGALQTSYKATYKKTLYNCTIYYGAVTCKQPGMN